jgi:hypothetical protein
MSDGVAWAALAGYGRGILRYGQEESMCSCAQRKKASGMPTSPVTAWSDSGIGAGYCTWLWKWQSHYDREASS